MKRIILDTDLGIDCDDAVAISLLAGFARRGECTVEAITTSTTRRGSVAGARVICDYYGLRTRFGKMRLPGLACDEKNIYAADLMDRYGASDDAEEAVSLMRKILAAGGEKVTLVSIGPFTNLRRLLESGADEWSPLGGAELVARSVEEVVSMACMFEPDAYGCCREWNVCQDIPAAEYVLRTCPVPITLSPGETGGKIFIGKSTFEDKDSPVAMSIALYHERETRLVGCRVRESWDPVTCFFAVAGEGGLFRRSEWGDVHIAEDGLALFTPNGEGKRSYFTPAIPPKDIETALEALIPKK